MTNPSSVIYYPAYSQIQVQQDLIWQVISSITNAFPMVVTTVNNHNYIAGMTATFLIPIAFGMQQLNNKVIQVLQLTTNTLTFDIDSTSFSPFAYPASLPSAYTYPVVIPYSSGPPLSPKPLPYGNENAFPGTIFNAGQPSNLI